MVGVPFLNFSHQNFLTNESWWWLVVCFVAVHFVDDGKASLRCRVSCTSLGGGLLGATLKPIPSIFVPRYRF